MLQLRCLIPNSMISFSFGVAPGFASVSINCFATALSIPSASTSRLWSSQMINAISLKAPRTNKTTRFFHRFEPRGRQTPKTQFVVIVIEVRPRANWKTQTREVMRIEPEGKSRSNWNWRTQTGQGTRRPHRARTDGAGGGRSDRGRGAGEERHRRLPGRRAVFGPGDDLPGERGRGAGAERADAEPGRHRRRESGRDDLARGGGDRRGDVQRGVVPRRGFEQGRRPAAAGDIGAARVRGAVRKYRRQLRLRDDRASSYA